MTVLTTRIGFEIELLAPPGADRRTLADAVAAEHGGRVGRVFHTDSEPSLVPGMGHFWHLTPGLTVHDGVGRALAALVDDITIVADVERELTDAGCGAPGHRPCAVCRQRTDGHWYRVLSDDIRLLRLVAERTDPDVPFDRVLDDVAVLFGSTVETIGAVRRLRDRSGASIAMASPLAPGRGRPCEIVTPPLRQDHEAALEALLRPARALGFRVPAEAAVHLHVDAAPFRSVSAFSNLVRLFGYWREALRTVLDTNPACTRLRPLPPELVALVEDTAGMGAGARPGGAGDPDAWHRLQAAASGTGLTKYFDVNLTALLTDDPVRDTVEVRILPGALHGAEIVRRAAVVEALLARCTDPTPIPAPTTSDPVEAVRELSDLAGSARERSDLAGSALGTEQRSHATS
ncbi:amidoligase family protein [Curtobacterium sp. Leaf261]|uniref:amidoligase family protein n=1 Tax=Curtobacterium sp. Leaf261 TaxID=1736311 RepID=UPI0006F517BE|nr:amidoligase family protein [Curtobacterium sp. Leaf261]KQO60044.1 hypothetical protein ASF23_15475 [Curtobacterium sp. Leaf261]